jgi:hypothetical protein
VSNAGRSSPVASVERVISAYLVGQYGTVGCLVLQPHTNQARQ